MILEFGAYMFDFHSFKILHIDDYMGIAHGNPGHPVFHASHDDRLVHHALFI